MQSTLKRIELPFQSRTLENGLRVLVQEDHTSPIVAVHIMYRVGSRDERIGRTGLAHLLEHLLFEGSANCPKGEFDRLLEGVGGTNNGSTWLDRTNYYEVVPSHAVELALWLERERMGHFLPVLDEEMLEVQRSVVINERKQVYENRPYGLAYEVLSELLFPRGHPYSWPTIGYTADLEAMTLADARTFYQSYYAPDNAVLALVGDLTPEQGFAWAQRYFGDLPAAKGRGGSLTDSNRSAEGLPAAGVQRAAATSDGALAPSTQNGGQPRVRTLPDRVSFPRIYHAYAVPGYGTPDWVALDVLSYLLADGDSSRLQRALIRELEVAQDVDTYLYPTQLAGVFGIISTARSGIDAERLMEKIDGVIERVVEEGVGAEEVEGAIRRARRDYLNGLGNVEDRAEELAYAATVLGDASRLEEVLNAFSGVTAEDVQRVARDFLAIENRATVVVVPNGQAAEEGEDE